MSVHRYQLRIPPIVSDLSPGYTATFENVIPSITIDVELLPDDDDKPNLDLAMEERGCGFVESTPPEATSRGIAQIQGVRLVADSDSIPVASGWTDVTGLSLTFDTKGGTMIALIVCATSAAISVGAEVRVLLSGGSFSNTLEGMCALPLLVGGCASFTTYEQIPTTETRTTYTAKIQVRGVGVFASVALRALASSLGVAEYA